MNRRFRPVAAFVLALVSFACGGGGGRGPTEPSAPSGKQFQFSVTAAPGNFEGNILEGVVSFDGREVSRVDWSRSGGGCFFPCEITANVQGISSGDHTVRFTVVRQERTTTLYQFVLSGFISDPRTGSREQVNQVSQSVRLRAGEGVNFTVRF